MYTATGVRVHLNSTKRIVHSTFIKYSPDFLYSRLFETFPTLHLQDLYNQLFEPKLRKQNLTQLHRIQRVVHEP